jgi:hypothetical protein
LSWTIAAIREQTHADKEAINGGLHLASLPNVLRSGSIAFGQLGQAKPKAGRWLLGA